MNSKEITITISVFLMHYVLLMYNGFAENISKIYPYAMKNEQYMYSKYIYILFFLLCT